MQIKFLMYLFKNLIFTFEFLKNLLYRTLNRKILKTSKGLSRNKLVSAFTENQQLNLK